MNDINADGANETWGNLDDAAIRRKFDETDLGREMKRLGEAHSIDAKRQAELRESPLHETLDMVRTMIGLGRKTAVEAAMELTVKEKTARGERSFVQNAIPLWDDETMVFEMKARRAMRRGPRYVIAGVGAALLMSSPQWPQIRKTVTHGFENVISHLK